MKLTFLGTGTAHGVPFVGCKCPTCSSTNEKNKRMRSSAYVEYENKGVLIDITPDFMQQVHKNNIERVDSILLTHTHADHLHGLDDIRPFNFRQQASIPMYGNPSALAEVKSRFSYMFNGVGGNKPQVELKEATGPFDLFGKIVEPLQVLHGRMEVTAYRIENLGYITDCKSLPEPSKNRLRNLEVLVVNCLQYKEHPTHLNLEEAISLIDELKPKRAYLTHMTHNFEHEKLKKELPDHILPAYDGLVVDVK